MILKLLLLLSKQGEVTEILLGGRHWHQYQIPQRVHALSEVNSFHKKGRAISGMHEIKTIHGAAPTHKSRWSKNSSYRNSSTRT